MTKNKTIGVVIVSLLIILCLVPCVWWSVVYFSGDEKLVVKTYEVDMQTLDDGTQQALLDVQVFRNNDNSGLKAIEYRLNYVMDESRTQFYSQGIQLIGNDFKVGNTRKMLNKTATQKWGAFNRLNANWTIYSEQLQFVSNVERYNYMSGSDYYDTLNDTNPINDDTFVRLTLKTGNSGNDADDYAVYGMKIKGANGYSFIDAGSNAKGEEPKVEMPYALDKKISVSQAGSFGWQENYWYSWIYSVFDYDSLMATIYNSVETLPAGTNHVINFKLGDWFIYYEYDEENCVYKISSVNEETFSKITEQVESYWAIKVRVYDSGLKKADESLFKCVRGSTTFNLTNDYTEDNYFVGRTNVTIDETMFIFVHVVDDKYALKLKQSFIDRYIRYKDVIYLTVDVNVDNLGDVEVIGFTADSGLDDFIVRSNNIVEVVNA